MLIVHNFFLLFLEKSKNFLIHLVTTSHALTTEKKPPNLPLFFLFKYHLEREMKTFIWQQVNISCEAECWFLNFDNIQNLLLMFYNGNKSYSTAYLHKWNIWGFYLNLLTGLSCLMGYVLSSHLFYSGS